MMKKSIFAALLLAFISFSAQAAEKAPLAYVMKVQEVITPATSDFIHRELKAAAAAKADVAVIEIDTPGGLMKSTQAIIQDILASSVPVACYVSPSGAHAASAGTYILYACHIAAMAPGTNLGAATPVLMGASGGAHKEKSTLETKGINDAAAMIRGLAEIHKRNAAWAESAVRDASSLSASEALNEKVIDVVAGNTDDLLSKIDGRSVTLQEKPHTLKTKGATLEMRVTDWRSRLLAIITDPNVSMLLMTIGFYGLIYEFAHPGAFFPGIMGGICLLLGLFAMNVLPVNYAGLALILLGLGCMTAEAFVPSFGVLGIGGAAAFAIGGLMLFDADVPGFGVSPWLIGALTLTSLGMLSFLLTVAVKARRRPVSTGAEGLRGATGDIVSWSHGTGEVLVAGAIWKARGPLEYILKKGDKIKVVEIDGLCLVVEPLR